MTGCNNGGTGVGEEEPPSQVSGESLRSPLLPLPDDLAKSRGPLWGSPT